MYNHQFNFCQSEYINCTTSDKSLEVHWHKSIPDNKIEQCIEKVGSLIKIIPVQYLFIDGSELESYEFGLNWKIIEHSWKAFYENGGKKIIVLNKTIPPGYILKEYKDAMKEYGIPLELEFRGL